MLMVIEEEMLPIRTDCVLLMRKLRIQLQRDVQTPGSLRLVIGFGGNDGAVKGQKAIVLVQLNIIKHHAAMLPKDL